MPKPNNLMTRKFHELLKCINIRWLYVTDTLVRQSKSQESGTNTSAVPLGQCMSGSNSAQNHVGSQIGQDDAPSVSMKTGPDETCKSEGTQAGGTLQQQQQLQQSSTKSTSTGTGTRNKDYIDDSVIANEY